MLGKLLKHEWKAIWKIPALLMGILWIMAFAAGLTFLTPIWQSELTGLSLLVFMVIMLFYFALIGISVGIMLYLAVHYYKSMFTDEGYLTHTLPVTSHQLLISKILPMSALYLLTTVGVLLALVIFFGMAFLIMAPAGTDYGSLFREVMALFAMLLQETGFSFPVFLITLVVMLLVGTVSNVMMIVGSVSIGQLVTKHKVLGSIGAYFAISTAVQVISMFVMLPVMWAQIYQYDETGNVFSVLTPLYMAVTLLSLGIGVGLYFLSEYMIRRKLNLE